MSHALRRPLLTVDDFQDWEPPPGMEDLRWELVGTETLRLTSIGYAGPLAEFYATTDLT